MIRIYPTDGPPHDAAAGVRATLRSVQTLVDGLIEFVPCRDRSVQVWANEEGLLRGLPYNATASARFGRHLVGQVVELSGKDLLS